MSIESRGVSDAGCVRTENEDRILVDADLGLYMVCDGMGGHRQGGLAAELAIEAVRYYVEASRNGCDVTWPFGYNAELCLDANRLLTATRVANRQIWRRAEQDLQCAGMGTTVVAVLAGGGRMVAANIGDSRLYRLRDGVLTQISVDDSMVGSMLRKGLLTAEEAQKHPMKNILTQAAGSQENVEAHILDEPILPGDLLLLSTDGVHGVVGDEEMRGILLDNPDLDAAVAALAAAAKGAGGPDNLSVLLVRQG
jgi:PPM family protein phosphatase